MGPGIIVPSCPPARAPPHWPAKYAKYHVFCAFEANFCSKNENSPQTGFRSRSCEGLAVIWTRIVEFFGSGAHPKSVKTFFLDHLISAGKTLRISVKTFFIFLRSPDFGRKNTLNCGEDFFFCFFGDRLIFTETPPQSNSRLMKIWVKFVYGLIKLPKKSPLCEILATRLLTGITDGGHCPPDARPLPRNGNPSCNNFWKKANDKIGKSLFMYIH